MYELALLVHSHHMQIVNMYGQWMVLHLLLGQEPEPLSAVLQTALQK